MQRRDILLGAGLIAVLAISAAVLFATRRQSFHGGAISPPMPAPEISLTDQSGQPFELSSLRGKVVFLYFGYTNCPDECPLTMAHLKLAVDSLADQSGDVKVVMVTTDPARDTQEVLKDWMGKFSPEFIGLYGTPDELEKVWKDYGVAVENGGETHSDFTFVIDRAGNLRETFLPDSLPVDEAADVRILLNEK